MVMNGTGCYGDRHPTTLVLRGALRSRGNIDNVQSALSSLPGVVSVFVNADADFIHIAYVSRVFDFNALSLVLAGANIQTRSTTCVSA